MLYTQRRDDDFYASCDDNDASGLSVRCVVDATSPLDCVDRQPALYVLQPCVDNSSAAFRLPSTRFVTHQRGEWRRWAGIGLNDVIIIIMVV